MSVSPASTAFALSATAAIGVLIWTLTRKPEKPKKFYRALCEIKQLNGMWVVGNMRYARTHARYTIAEFPSEEEAIDYALAQKFKIRNCSC